jgi:large subunit ribosomal protein L10e
LAEFGNKKMKPSNFREVKGMPYTRKEYIGGIPGSKIVRFNMGTHKENYDYTLELLALKEAQIRHNALEAARVAANRVLENRLGRENYLLKIIPYPHQVLREHKRINVAQADRFQEGMKKAYGKPVGVAARVGRRDTVIVAKVDKAGLEEAKEALNRAGHKLPVPVKILQKENGED